MSKRNRGEIERVIPNIHAIQLVRSKASRKHTASLSRECKSAKSAIHAIRHPWPTLR